MLRISNKIIIIFLLSFFSFSFLRIAITADEEKHFVTVSEDQPFSTNSIIVIMQHNASMTKKNYTIEDFSEVMPNKIVDNDPYTYELIVKYLDGENTGLSQERIDAFRRSLTLKWNNEKTKSEIIEAIHLLELREDIHCVQPDYLYVSDSGVFEANYDMVPENIWKNYYYIRVSDKDSKTFINEDYTHRYVISAVLIKSYDKIVDAENEYDVFLNNILDNQQFKFVVDEQTYSALNIGNEYIIKLNKTIELKNKKTKQYESMMMANEHKYDSELIRVINNRLYFNIVEQLYSTNADGEEKQVRSIRSNTIFCRSFNQYIFKKTFVKNDLPFEFELEYVFDPVGSYIKVNISDEEKAKMDPNIPYVYYYYKCGVFLMTGDNILMMDEYMKLAKEVSINNTLFEPEEVSYLRAQAYLNIKRA